MSDADRNDLMRDFLDELEGPEREEVDRVSAMSPDSRSTLERLDVELLGLLGLAAEPVEPAPGRREEILLAVARASVAAPEMGPEMDPEPAEEPAPAPSEPRDPGAIPFPELLPPPRRRSWALPLAATVAAASLFAAGWFKVQLDEHKQAVEALSRRLDTLSETQRRLSEAESGYQAAMAELETARTNLGLVTARGVELCPLLSSQGEEEVADRPMGVLYLAPDHQHWYLSVHDLAPAPTGQTYQLWFIADEGPVRGGALSVPDDGSPIEMTSASMPQGTRAISVTLELGEPAEQPAGESVLFGDQVRSLL